MFQDSNNPNVITDTAIEGTSGNDVLDSCVEKEEWISDDSSDLISGVGGFEAFCHFYQNIKGCDGNDTISADVEADTINGGDDDSITGSSGKDSLNYFVEMISNIVATNRFL